MSKKSSAIAEARFSVRWQRRMKSNTKSSRSRFTKKCPKCGKGHMIATGKMIAKETLQFPHKCDKCGHKENYTNTYPYSRYEYSEVKE